MKIQQLQKGPQKDKNYSPNPAATQLRLRPWRRRWRAAAPALLDALDREHPRADGKSPIAGHRGPTPSVVAVVDLDLASLLHEKRRRRSRHPTACGEGETMHNSAAGLRARVR